MLKQLTASILSVGLIAPSFANTGADVTVSLVSLPVSSNSYTIDTYDPTLGSYGKDNAFGEPTFKLDSVMPEFTAPTGLPDMNGSVAYNTGKHTISSDMVCDNFTIDNGATVTIQGDVTLVVNKNFRLENDSRIVLAADATLTVYCAQKARVDDASHLNTDTTRPNDVVFYQLGSDTLRIDNNASMVATVFVTNAMLQIDNNADFYGAMTGQTSYVGNNAGAHFCNTPAQAVPSTVAPLYD